MKIAVLHRADLTNVRVLSGTPFYMMQALAKHVGEVIPVCADRSVVTRVIEVGGKVVNRLSVRLTGKRISSDHHALFGRRLGRVFTQRVAKTACDVIFAPMASAELAYLETSRPIVYLSDLTWANIVDYYPGATGLHAGAERAAEAIERRAMAKPVVHIYPSEWAARTAIEHYKVPAERVHILPLGANFEAEDIPAREFALQHGLGDELNLLWVGVNWERKGGPIAHAALMSLLSKGVKARLVVCGCVPPPEFLHERVEVIPYLNKQERSDRGRLSKLFLAAHFLLFPTQAEAMGIVVCEASAHGLPSLVRDTGGVAGGLHDGVNGYLMPPEAQGADYADKIVSVTADAQGYANLVRQSRDLYESSLNWDAWGRAMKPIFEQAAGKKAD